MRAANCLEALVRCGNAAALGCQEVAVTGLMGQFEAVWTKNEKTDKQAA